MILHATKKNMYCQLTFDLSEIDDAIRTVNELQDCGWEFDDLKVIKLMDIQVQETLTKRQLI